jgi:lipid A 4'-phosphatase
MAEHPWQDLIWRAERAKGWSAETRLLGAFLLSGPASNRIGCFAVNVAEIAEHTGIPVDGVTDQLATLALAGFIRHDQAAGWAWIPDVLRRHPFADSEEVRGALPEIAAVPREAAFRDELIQVFRLSADRPGASPAADPSWLGGLVGDQRAADLARGIAGFIDRSRKHLPGLPIVDPRQLHGVAGGLLKILDYLRRWQAFVLDLMNTRGLRFLASLFVALAVLFVVFPGIDLGVARWFFVPPRSFTLGETRIGRFFDSEIHFAMEWFLVLLIGVFVYGLVRKRVYWGLTPKNFLFVALSIGLSAGLVTNVIFKDSWGRARPSQIVEFGGTKQFSPPFMRSTQCDKNCSFVSGDASLATSFLVFAMIARRNKLAWWAGLGSFAVLVGLMRMGRGSHFLSDVVFAMIFTLMILLVVGRAILDDRWRYWPRLRNPSGDA